jgi:hypothetical protein
MKNLAYINSIICDDGNHARYIFKPLVELWYLNKFSNVFNYVYKFFENIEKVNSNPIFKILELLEISNIHVSKATIILMSLKGDIIMCFSRWTNALIV